MARDARGTKFRGGAGWRRGAPLVASAVAASTVLAACSAGPGSSAASTASPSATDGGTASAPPGTTYTVPIKVVRHGRAAAELVPVYINGHGPYTFLLDTGSSVSSVSKKLAKTLKLPATGRTTEIKGVVNSAKVPVVTIRHWRVGHATLIPGKVAEIKLSRTAGKVAGLLGSDELSRFAKVTLNFRLHQLRLTRP